MLDYQKKPIHFWVIIIYEQFDIAVPLQEQTAKTTYVFSIVKINIQ